MLSNHIPAVDAAGHVPIYTSEWRWAWADAWRLYLHVTCGAEHHQWGLGVRHLAGHGAVGAAAWKLHQPSGWVWYLGRSWVRNRNSRCSQQTHRPGKKFSSGPNVHRQSQRGHHQKVETFLHVFLLFLSLALRSYSILNCAPPSSSGSAGGLLLDGQLSDSLLDSLMEASSPAGLCPPMQVQHDCQRVLVIITSLQEMEMVTLTSCLCQVTRTACQPSLSKMRLFVCRHGERMDVVFGKHWVAQCFDSKGQHAVVD